MGFDDLDLESLRLSQDFQCVSDNRYLAVCRVSGAEPTGQARLISLRRRRGHPPIVTILSTDPRIETLR